MSWRWYQFSLLSLFAMVTAYAAAVVAIVKIPHVVVFTVASICVFLSSRAAYRSMRRGRTRMGLVLTSVVAWAVLGMLSIGPFIALSEAERRICGQYHIGSLGRTFRPVMILYFAGPFRWYVNKWIPSDATGLQAASLGDLQPLVGTWKGDIGNLLNLRQDGTARWRSSSGDKEIGYFEWTLQSNEVAFYQYSSKRSLPAWLGRDVIDYSPTDRLTVEWVTATQFQLRSTTGQTTLFTRTQDPELESAP